jgi:hypothetical protein
MIGTDSSLKSGGTIALTDLWCRILTRVMASKPLLAKKSVRKGRFSFPFPHIVTGLKSLWEPISSTIAVE